MTQEAGLHFVYQTGTPGHWHFAEIMGGGAALFDADADGDLDLYLTGGHRDFPEQLVSDHVTNALFVQDQPWRFRNVTGASGLDNRGHGMGVAVGDIDNDGDLDLLATSYGSIRMYENQGAATFRDITRIAGLDGVDGWCTSAALFDYDRDGFLDVYITRYLEVDPAKVCFDASGRRDYCDPRDYTPVTDILLHNDGDATFRDVSAVSGIGAAPFAGLGVVCDDYNDDGWPDVYVANDEMLNNLWINQHDGTFRDDALLMGVAVNAHGQAEGGMGVVSGDVDNDGNLDLFLSHFRQETNTLYRNLGAGGGFADVTAARGLGWSSLPYTGFGVALFDAERDGDLDLLVGNGRVGRADAEPNAAPPPPWHYFAEPNLFYLNDGASQFELADGEGGPLCEPVEITRGVAVGDIDNDGDRDLLVANIETGARLYRNDAPRPGHWLQVRARDPRLRRDAVGAHVTAYCGDRRFVRTIQPGGSYLSANDLRACFGFGSCRHVERIDVRWPDGLRERFGPVAVDQAIVVDRGTGTSKP